MQSRTLHLRVGRSVWAAVLLLATAVGAASPTHAQSITVTDAVSREVAVLVDPSIGQQKPQLVLDAVSREVAVLVDASTGQQKPQLVLDAVSRELAVRVEPTFGFDKGQLVRDSVSREFQIYVNPTDANGNGIADLLEPTAQTEMVYAS